MHVIVQSRSQRTRSFWSAVGMGTNKKGSPQDEVGSLIHFHRETFPLDDEGSYALKWSLRVWAVPIRPISIIKIHIWLLGGKNRRNHLEAQQ